MAAPTGNLNTTNLSINHLIEQQRNASLHGKEDLPNEPFDKDDVIRLWKVAAHAQRAKGHDQVYHVMIKREPTQFDESTFRFEVDNTIQMTRLESALGEILAYIRQELKNYSLVILPEIVENAEEEIRYLNGPDKFEKMAKKNTNLFDLKNRFNLDIDY